MEVFGNLKDTFCVSGQPCNILYALKRAFARNNKVEVIALSSKSLEFIYLFILDPGRLVVVGTGRVTIFFIALCFLYPTETQRC